MSLNQDEMERRDGQALKLRLKYEMGLISREELQKQAAQWDEEKRADMRERFSASVESVQQLG